jgi:type III restriction enzyme
MIKQIIEKYHLKEEDLLQKLDDENVIKRNNDFKETGFDYIKANYPLIFEGVDSNKIRKANTQKKKLKIRIEKYGELKELWEKLNEKVVLEYKIENENKFKEIFVDFLKNTNLIVEGTKEKTAQVGFENNIAVIKEETAIYGNEIIPISTMKYEDFLKQLSSTLNINLKTIHECFIETNTGINNYLNQSTLRIFKQKFDNYLMYKAFSKFTIEYQKVKSTVHPTKITDANGNIKDEVEASDVGIFYSDEKVADKFLFDQLFYDSELEKDNIKENITDVIVFTKIPKNSIKIPVAGGKSYSPDFAYVMNFKDGNKRLYFIVETKNTDEESLRNEEKQKIAHAERFFGNSIIVKFGTQFSAEKITNLIHKTYSGG